MKDLVVLCADKMIEGAVEGLLRRPAALGIRPIGCEIKVHPQRDPGCYHQAAAFLRPLRSSFEHALVMFDRDWDGAPTQDAGKLAHDVQDSLASDWGQNASAIVINPELEVWVWSDSPVVEEKLGWVGHGIRLRPWLESKGLWSTGDAKPTDPKAAVLAAVREVKIPWTSAVCKELASKVGVHRCTDTSFIALKSLLSDWFGVADTDNA
jgi:hypothetical protein